jgi:hypothetical protein
MAALRMPKQGIVMYQEKCEVKKNRRVAPAFYKLAYQSR